MNEASTTVPACGMTKLISVNLKSYPSANLVFLLQNLMLTMFKISELIIPIFICLTKGSFTIFRTTQKMPVCGRYIMRCERMAIFLEIQVNDHLFALVLVLKTALKNRLCFLVLWHF